MLNLARLLPAAVVVVAGFGLGATAIAVAESEQSASPDTAIEEIIVTATHRETNLMDTAVTISAVDGDTIEQLGATNVLDLFRALPGLNAVGGGTGNNRLVIRGISSQNVGSGTRPTNSAIAVYIDDTPMTSANGSVMGSQRQLAGALFDVQRVEVLKGPQGTLFGEGSQGGTVRYIYNEPDASAPDYRVQAGAFLQNESDDTGYRLDGMVNIPLSEDFAVRISAFHDDAAGWIDKFNVTPARKDINATKSTGGRIAAKWRASERLTALASVYITDTETDGPSEAYTPYEESVHASITHNPARSAEEVSLFSLRLDYDFDFATLTSVTSYYDREASATTEWDPGTVYFLDIVYGLLANFGGIPSPCTPRPADVGFALFDAYCPNGDGGSISAWGIDGSYRSERFIQELRLVSDTDGPLLWTAGLFYKTSDDLRKDPQQALFNPGREFVEGLWADLFASPPRHAGYDPTERYFAALDEISGFAEATYALSDAFSITAGARVSRLEQDFEYGGYGTKDTVVSPRATLAWQPTDDALLYLNYARGFRPGNVNYSMEFNRRNLATALSPDAAERLNNALTFNGDTLDNFEIGAKLSFADGRAQLIAAAYHQEWKDMITEFFDDVLSAEAGVGQYNANAGDSHSQGLELELNWEVADGLLLRFAGDINEAETDEDSILAPKGSKLLYAPEWSLSASVDYRFNLPGNLEGRFRADHQRVAKQFAQIQNDVLLDKYDLTSLRVSLSDRADARWTASIFVDNLFNDEIILNKLWRRDFGGTVRNIYARPRMIGFQVSFGAGS